MWRELLSVYSKNHMKKSNIVYGGVYSVQMPQYNLYRFITKTYSWKDKLYRLKLSNNIDLQKLLVAQTTN
jgi:hypothetical protein